MYLFIANRRVVIFNVGILAPTQQSYILQFKKNQYVSEEYRIAALAVVHIKKPRLFIIYNSVIGQSLFLFVIVWSSLVIFFLLKSSLSVRA
jgi:hypothetical protein